MFAEMSISKKAFNLIPILPVYLVIFSVTYGFTKFYFLDINGFYLTKILISLIFYTCSLMVIISHLRSMFTSPGYVYEGWEKDYENIYSKNSEKNDSITIINEHDKNLFCQKCSMKRPARSHHCKICKKCVLKMDHHCPWIANCVGHGNQKYFYVFLFYAALGDCLAFIVLLLKCLELDMDLYFKNAENKNLLSVLMEPLMLITCTALALAMTLAIGFLYGVQTRFLMYNSTTIESRKFETYEESPYYYENHFFNFKIVMGEKYSEWFLPIFKKNIYNNGYYFVNQKKQVDDLNFSSVRNVRFSGNDQDYKQLDGTKISGDYSISIGEKI